MKPYFAALTVLMLLFSCSRQPVRVAGTMPQGPAPAETIPPTVTPAQEASPGRMSQDMERAPNATSPESVPQKGDSPIAPKVRVVQPDTKTNETANIENQGAIGSLPITDDEVAEAPAEAPIVTLSKSACYGDCDVYTVSYLPSGTATLTVTNGLMGAGTYRTELSSLDQREMSNRLDSLREMDFATFYPESEEVPTDIQFTRLVLPDEDAGGRTITVYFDAPAALQRFMERMEAFVEDSNWKIMPAPRR